MKKKVGIFALLLIGFVLFVAIRFFILENQDTTGELRVVSSPASTLFINNVAIGKVPFDDKYKAGEYLLKLIPEENASQTASWQRKIKVYKKTLTFVNIDLGSSDISTSGEVIDITRMEKLIGNDKGEINIETEPTGAIIYLDNDEKGISSVLLSNVSKGDHELSVFMPGFFRRTQKVNVIPGYRINAYIKLAVDPNQSPAFKSEEPEKEATGTPTITKPVTKNTITIIDTPTGWLRVREDATINASESGRVNPGDTFEAIEEKDGWYKIEFEEDKTGWISVEYTRKEE